VEFVLKGRGTHISDRDRQAAERKLGKVARLDRRVQRLEIEIIEEHNPRLGSDSTHRVEIVCQARRRVLRAHGVGPDVDSALDQAVGRLARQIATYRSKLRARLTRRANRVESARTSPEGSSSSE